jgi:hypothetical protein
LKPIFRFTLGGDLGSKTITEPEGWNKIIFNLERDLTYWSLIENFELPLIFYYSNGRVDGGYSYLDSARTAGVDTLVTLEIQVSWDDGDTFQLCFDGRIDVSTCKEIVFRKKIEAAVVRNDLWAQFMANKSTPVNLLSNTDIYGGTRYGIPYQVLNMTSQTLYKQYVADLSTGNEFFSTDTAAAMSGQYFQYDWDEEVLAEIQTKFSIPTDINPSKPGNIFEIDEDGTYYIYLRIEASLFTRVLSTSGGSCVFTDTYAACETYVDFYFQLNSNAEEIFSYNTYGVGAQSTVFEYAHPLTLKKGDILSIYGKLKANVSNDNTHNSTLILYGKAASTDVTIRVANIFIPTGTCLYANQSEIVTLTQAAPSGSSNPTQINFYGDTSYTNTQADTVLIHDAGLSICDRVLGKDDSFYSAFLGGAHTAIFYPANGCGYLNALTRGLNIRGYNFTEKPFTLSFDDYWAGINPVFNLGLGYEELSVNSPGSTVIRVEQKSYFFNSTPLVYLNWVNDINIEYDLNMLTKTIEIGFEQWQAESIAGIDDPQTKHTYNLRWKTFGKDEKQLSKFIAASLAIEQTRRLTKVQSQDWRLDENIFIIALQSQDTSVIPETSPPTVTEQPELFGSGVSGMNNPTTRYNIRHTPARMLKRWIDFYSGQLQSYPSESFKYGSGQGNVLMSWTGDTCDSGALTENQNQNVSTSYLFLPIVYSFTHPLTWDQYVTIRDNRNHAINITWKDTNGNGKQAVLFIKKLGYEINKSKGVFECWVHSISDFLVLATDEGVNLMGDNGDQLLP